MTGSIASPMTAPPVVHVVSLNDSHAEAVTSLHLQAFAATSNVRLGRGYARSLVELFRRRNDCISLVAIADDGQVVGCWHRLLDRRSESCKP
jgi:hypothetical protein